MECKHEKRTYRIKQKEDISATSCPVLKVPDPKSLENEQFSLNLQMVYHLRFKKMQMCTSFCKQFEKTMFMLLVKEHY